MPKLADHLQQAEKNLFFLENIATNAPNDFDWHVTVCFYTALHLINAHISKSNIQPRSHFDTLNLINPHGKNSVFNVKLSEDAYDAYRALQQLSRRSRYLVNEKDGQLLSSDAAWTYAVHSSKAFRHLDTLLDFFKSNHKILLPTIKITHPNIKQSQLKCLIV